jgi:hypothetical protein
MLISHTFQENQCMLKVFVECTICFGELKEACSSFSLAPTQLNSGGFEKIRTGAEISRGGLPRPDLTP